MAILDIQTVSTGLVGPIPSIVYIRTNDTVATVTTAGYLNNVAKEVSLASSTPNIPAVLGANQAANIALVQTTTGIAWFEISISGGNTSLTEFAGPGGVQLPVVANHIATFVGTSGEIGDQSTTGIMAGSLQAGLSGTAGNLYSYPATPLKGFLEVSATANTGNTPTIITNAAMGQSSIISIPDPGAATANFIISQSAGTQSIATGNLTLTAGNFTATAGNIVATAGSVSATAGAVSAGTTVTGGTGIVATTGNIAATAGNVTAGSSGNAGTLTSFPGTASNGSLIIAAVNNAGNHTCTISNSASLAENAVYTLSDSASAGQTIPSFASPTVNGNLVKATGISGQLGDAGINALNGMPLNAAGSISAVNFQGMYATPVQLIPTPGAGFGIIVLNAYLELVFVTAAPAGGGAIIFQYANTIHGAGTNVITNAAAATIPAAFATGAAANQFQVLVSLNQGTTASAGIVNLGVFLSNATNPFTANGGASSLNYSVSYIVVPM